MPRIHIDPEVHRTEIDGFAFPLGVAPVEPLKPRAGYVVEFESADGVSPEEGADDEAGGEVEGPADDGDEADEAAGAGAVAEPLGGEMLRPTPGEDWEEWPDRFMFDALVSSEKLPTLVRTLLSLLPGRVFPILDVMGHDDYREIDPYIAYDLVGMDRVFEGLRLFGSWLLEDGTVGFGAMSLDPFLYVFVDEHKAVTVRAQLDFKEKIERILAAFELEAVPEIRGADSVAHEHRNILLPPEREPDALTSDDLLDRLRDMWMLQLNVDARSNVDDEGRALGITAWRCLMRCIPEGGEGPDAYAEVLLHADCLETAEKLASEAVGKPAKRNAPPWAEIEPLNCDRLSPEHLAVLLGQDKPMVNGLRHEVHAVNWLEDERGG